MKTLLKCMAIFCAIFLTSCATTEFKVFEGKNNVFDGRGGTKVLIDNMEVWDNGEPPRRFKLLGIIDDHRSGGIIPMSRLRSDIVKKAREVGGDAVIELDNQSRITGFYSTGSASASSYGSSSTAYGSSTTIPVRRNVAKFAVIQYID